MKLLPLLAFAVHVSSFAAMPKIRQGLSLPSKRVSLLAAESGSSSEPANSMGGDATMAATTFNIAKSIVGAGVLSLPSGVAFFADKPSALIPASLMCTAMGLVSAYTYSLIGKACAQHNSSSFQDVWEKSADPKTAWIVR